MRAKERRRDRSRSPRRRSPPPPPPPTSSHRRRSRSPHKKRRSPSPRSFRRGRTPPNGLGDRRTPGDDVNDEDLDARTVFCMQLSQRIRARDLQEFFSSVGKVRDVRLITCNKTKRFKGIAYIEFRDPESVPLVSSSLVIYPESDNNLSLFLFLRLWVCLDRNCWVSRSACNTHKPRKIASRTHRPHHHRRIMLAQCACMSAHCISTSPKICCAAFSNHSAKSMSFN